MLRWQLVAEEAATLQAAGRAMAFVTLRMTPSWALLRKASQMHSASVLSTVFSPEQHVPSGFSTALPFETNDRQSAIVSTKLEQSTAGAAAPPTEVDALHVQTDIVMMNTTAQTDTIPCCHVLLSDAAAAAIATI